MAMAIDLTWRFEVKLRDDDRWQPYAKELSGNGDWWSEHVGTHDMPEAHRDLVEFAVAELDGALRDLAEDSTLHGFTAARILVWEGNGTDGDPDVVLRASEEQFAMGRLRVAASEVHQAVRALEEARAKLRNQAIIAKSVDGLGTNKIAREVDGALARRLVLQFLAGYELVRTVDRALPADWVTEDHREAPSDWGWGSEWAIGKERLGPYLRGPVKTTLEMDGTVHLSLVDINGPVEPFVHKGYATDEEMESYNHVLAERAQAYAEDVLPRLHRNRLRLTTTDGSDADVDALAASITQWGNTKLVVTRIK